MHGTVCVGDAGTPLRPAIIWADQRSEKQVTQVYRTLGKSKLALWTCNPLATGFMLPSWLWLRQHEPEISSQVRWLMLPKDYVRFTLTGEPGAEPSDASSTSLFDPVIRRWSLPLIDALDLDARVLPTVQPSASVAGGLLPAIAEHMGLQAGTPVIFGGSDQAMQALGNGVIEPGVLSSTIGTGGQLFAPTRSCVVDSNLRMQSFCHVLPECWHAETAILSAGLSLRWLLENVLKGGSFQTLADAASNAPPGADGVFFLPYLLGERTPHMDPRARGGLVGLSKFHNQNHIIRAVMEGVVYALRQGLALMTDLHVPIEKVVVSGGAAAHPLWVQLQADIYNHPVYRTKTVEAAAFGAAILAGVGAGIYGSAQHAVAETVRWHEFPILPRPDNVAVYDRGYQHFTALYPVLMPINYALDKKVK